MLTPRGLFAIAIILWGLVGVNAISDEWASQSIRLENAPGRIISAEPFFNYGVRSGLERTGYLVTIEFATEDSDERFVEYVKNNQLTRLSCIEGGCEIGVEFEKSNPRNARSAFQLKNDAASTALFYFLPLLVLGIIYSCFRTS